MGFIRKLLGIGLGWTLGGPIGAIIGVAIASLIDASRKMYFNEWQTISNGNPYSQYSKTTQPGDFEMCIIVLTAAMMKVDGKVMKSELNFVKQFFIRNFGEERAANNIKLLQNVYQQNFSIEEVAKQINQNLDYSSKLLVLQYMFGIANADNVINDIEIEFLQKIANYIGVTNNDYQSIKAMFVTVQSVDYYKILEITSDATNDEVKKAYREMANKHHPDKVAHLGEEAQRAAQEKFQIIQDAYDKIKSQRGFK